MPFIYIIIHSQKYSILRLKREKKKDRLTVERERDASRSWKQSLESQSVDDLAAWLKKLWFIHSFWSPLPHFTLNSTHFVYSIRLAFTADRTVLSVAQDLIPTNGRTSSGSAAVSTERYKAISLQSLDKVAEDHPQIKPFLHDIQLAGQVFPFKASPYYVDELIDWDAEDVKKDPFYRLVFPTLDMLVPEHRERLEEAHVAGDPTNLIKVVGEIREHLNPHPAGQTT